MDRRGCLPYSRRPGDRYKRIVEDELLELVALVMPTNEGSVESWAVAGNLALGWLRFGQIGMDDGEESFRSWEILRTKDSEVFKASVGHDSIPHDVLGSQGQKQAGLGHCPGKCSGTVSNGEGVLIFTHDDNGDVVLMCAEHVDRMIHREKNRRSAGRFNGAGDRVQDGDDSR